MSHMKKCPKCGKENTLKRYFCEECGSLLEPEEFENSIIYEESELKVMRIIENLDKTPHNKILWSDTVDLYAKKVEKFKAIMNLPEMSSEGGVAEKMTDFLELCSKPEFQIAFVGTIKTGKSTLINSLLGHNYASMAVTPETAALTKFRSSAKDYVKVTFYTKKEWKELWDSRSDGADAFINEYNELNAEAYKDKWVGHKPITKEIDNSDIEKELAVWSSSKHAEHYFVKEIEVGISSLPENFPKQVVFVDTPGLSDPVAYRSEITKQYIRKANAVFVCVDAQKVHKAEIETISSVFSFSSHNKSKVHIISTHWDKLNDPEEDWREQKQWMKKQLVGKGFFDTAEMAETNILHSAAHVYNLCRDFDELDGKQKISLMSFGLIMGMDISDLKACVPEMMNKANIDNIRQAISEKIAGNYQTLLCQDLEKKYMEIIYTLKRIAKDEQKEVDGIIEVTKADIDKMKAKVAEQKKKYDEISSCRQQLTAILKSVEKNTQRRVDVILPGLFSAMTGEKKKPFIRRKKNEGKR